MNEHRILPFYMTYSMPYSYEKDDSVMRDLEYMQQLYPAEAKKYQKKIASILDKIDYEGSLIYNEYPDRWLLYKLSKDIYDVIRQEALNDSTQSEIPPEKWDSVSDMVQILLYYEIYKRRHYRKYGILNF